MRYFLALLILLTSCSSGSKSDDQSIPYLVTYRVFSSSSSATISYLDQGGQLQSGVLPLPWSVSFSASPGDELFLSASTFDIINSDPLFIEIIVDGQVVSSNQTILTFTTIESQYFVPGGDLIPEGIQ